QRQEMLKAFIVKSEAGRELPQKGAQFLFEPQDAGGKEIGERGFDVAELLQMGDEPAALDHEHKALRGLVVPSRKGIGVLQRIMGAVDLDRVAPPAGMGELIGIPQSRWVKAPAPASIGPAGDADSDMGGAAHLQNPREYGKRPRC